MEGIIHLNQHTGRGLSTIENPKKAGGLRSAGQETIRRINETIVLNYIRYVTPISRASIAKATGLQRSTISIIIDDLIRNRIIYEVRAPSARRGRVPYYLYLNPDYIYVIGVDVGLLQTTIALSDFTGRILEREIFATEKDPQGFVSKLVSAMKPLVDKARSRSHLDGIGIAVPGLVDNSGKIRLAPNLGWRDFDLGPILKEEFGVPVYVENVSKSAAMAHLWQDDLPGIGKNYVYVFVSSGIGTGLVFNGQLHAGFSGTAGEFGHMVIDPNGPECACGNRGCWEVIADNRSALRRYLQKVPDGSGRPLTIQELVALAREGNEAAREAIAETAEYLAIGIGNILVSLNPECVIVDGELTKVWDILGEVIQKSLKRGVFGLELEHMRIMPSSMKLKPSLVGAISCALSGHFAPPTFNFYRIPSLDTRLIERSAVLT